MQITDAVNNRAIARTLMTLTKHSYISAGAPFRVILFPC